MNQKHILERRWSSSGVSVAGKRARIGLLALIAFSLLNTSFAGTLDIELEAQQRGMSQLQRQPRGNTYETFYYKNGALSIEAYFYKPAGNGPFRLVIYNHGSAAGQERQ